MKGIVCIGLSGLLLMAELGSGRQKPEDPDPNNPGGSQANGSSTGAAVYQDHTEKKTRQTYDRESSASATQRSSEKKSGHAARKAKKSTEKK